MSRTPPEVLEKIAKLGASGHSSAEIGRIVGKSKKAIQKLALKYDLPRLPPYRTPGKRNHFYKQGYTIDKDGYKLVLKRPPIYEKDESGYIREHRLVVEEALGRRLTKGEVVHHIDKNKLNNAIENLKLFSKNSEHLKEELTGKVPKWSKDGIRRMKEDWKKSVAVRKQSAKKNQ